MSDFLPLGLGYAAPTPELSDNPTTVAAKAPASSAGIKVMSGSTKDGWASRPLGTSAMSPTNSIPASPRNATATVVKTITKTSANRLNRVAFTATRKAMPARPKIVVELLQALGFDRIAMACDTFPCVPSG